MDTVIQEALISIHEERTETAPDNGQVADGDRAHPPDGCRSSPIGLSLCVHDSTSGVALFLGQ
jgi:hypothetical protein